MVGFFTAVTKLLDPEAVRKAVADSVPSNFRELNLKAFEKGYEYGLTSAQRTDTEELDVVYSEE
jgi:2-oxoglutarate ferredoxin oxidoreductase subunit gamma